MRQIPCTLFFAAAAFALAGPTAAQELKGHTWTYDKIGMQMTVPDGFAVIPLQTDEQWIVAKFLSDKTYLSKDKDWNAEHKPLLRVIVFTAEAVKDSGVEVHEGENGSKFVGVGAVPYQGYRDYVKRNRTGFFFSKEDQDKVAGQECLMCEIDVHKDTPKLHLYTVVFHRPKFEVAVELEVLEDRKDQLEKIARKALESVRLTDPETVVSAPTTGAGKRTSVRLWTAFRGEWKKRPIAERTDIRKKMETEHHEAVRKRTPDDWKVSESEHFLVVSHCDERFTKRMVDGAEVFYDWCKQEFGKLGEDYVRRPVLRLCKDFDEYKAYHFDSSGTTGWSAPGDDFEIGTYWDDYNGSSGRDISMLLDRILIHFLTETDSAIVEYTPFWLTYALDDYVSAARIKGKKVDFGLDDYVRDESRDMQREGKLPKLRDILEMDADKYIDMRKTDRRAGYATTQALRFVLGPGARDKQLKDFLQRYFKASIAAAEKHDKDWTGVSKSAETEEEEERQMKERSSRNKERRKQVQKEINDAVFVGCGDKDWEKFEKGYDAFVRAGK